MMQAVYNQKLIRLKKLVTVELDNNLLQGYVKGPCRGDHVRGSLDPLSCGGGGR